MVQFEYGKCTALVTGASRGIGAALARELARRGVGGLVLTARTEKDLRAMADELAGQYPQLTIATITADLSDPNAPQLLKAETDKRGLSIDLLVNNAGFGSHGAFDTLPLDKELGMIQVNIAALVALTHLYLPRMLAQGWGGVLNVSSTGSFQPVPYMTTYAATKAFVQSFTEALYVENQDLENDVRFIALCPGGTETHFGDALGTERGQFEKYPHMTPEEVAIAALDGLDKNEMYVIPGIMNQVGAHLPRLLPRETAAQIAGGIFRPSNRKPVERKVWASQQRTLTILAGSAIVGAIAVALLRTRRGNN
jgi:hypothetical protein